MILADSGALVALANSKDEHHDDCVRALQDAVAPRLVPSPAVTEVCYLLRREAGQVAETAFLRSFEESDFLTLTDVTSADLARAADLEEQYASLPLDATDACLIALAERLGVTDVASIDSDMRIVKPRHVDHLTVVPDGRRSTPRTQQ